MADCDHLCEMFPHCLSVTHTVAERTWSPLCSAEHWYSAPGSADHVSSSNIASKNHDLRNTGADTTNLGFCRSFPMCGLICSTCPNLSHVSEEGIDTYVTGNPAWMAIGIPTVPRKGGTDYLTLTIGERTPVTTCTHP